MIMEDKIKYTEVKNMDVVYENHLNIGTYYMSMFKTVATYSANMVARENALYQGKRAEKMGELRVFA